MQFQSRQIHLLWSLRHIKTGENARDLVRVLWRHSLTLVLLVEPFQAFVAKALNHCRLFVLLLIIVMRQVSLVKFSNFCLLIGTIASRIRIDNSSLSEPDPQIIDLRPPGHDFGGRERAPRLNGKPLGEALLLSFT